MTYEEFIEQTKDQIAAATLQFAIDKEYEPANWSSFEELVLSDPEIKDFAEWVVACEIGEIWLGITAVDEMDRCLDITKEIFPIVVDQTIEEAMRRMQTITE